MKDTNLAQKDSEGELDNSFLLDEELPKASIELKKHMAKWFMDRGMNKDDIKSLLAFMD